MKRNGLLFIAGSTIYPLIEILWRGHSHYTMAIAGGICLILINKICVFDMKKRNPLLKCLAGAAIITLVEFATGIIVNRIFHLNVWDYSQLPYNIMGQICIPFSIIWFFLTMPAMYLCNIVNQLADKVDLPMNLSPDLRQ